jgi:hypothetical protein
MTSCNSPLNRSQCIWFYEELFFKDRYTIKACLNFTYGDLQSCHKRVLKGTVSLSAFFSWLPFIKKAQLDGSFQVNCMTTFYLSTLTDERTIKRKLFGFTAAFYDRLIRAGFFQ